MREGDEFNNYVVRQHLATGGMADIFRAERKGALEINREVCIKCIRRELCADAEFVQMFIDEARLSMTLSHSNIVQVQEVGLHRGELFMVMEWVHGTDASKVLKALHARGRAMPVDAALHLVAEVLEALEYAHHKRDRAGHPLGVVHRDVTPHNVMVSYVGEVKLTDFGIAKATSRVHQTRGEVIKGKVSYMAPEQAIGGALDNRTDLFAVGVIAFELLTGRKPFKGETQFDGVQVMLRGERASARDLRPEVPPEVDAFLDRILAVEADRRFPDASAARDVLGAIPALATGHRTLQRLLRELYPDEQHSTELPRFAAPEPDFPATEVVTPFAPARPSSRPSAPPPSVTPTGPDPARTLTAAPVTPAPHGPVDVTLRAAQPATPPRPVTHPPPVAPAPAPTSRVWPAVAAGSLVLAVVSVTAAVVVTRGTAAPAATPTSTQLAARPPAPAPAPTPAPTAAPAPAPTAAPTPTPTPAPAPAPVPAAQPAEESEARATLTVVALPWGNIVVGRQRATQRGVFRLRPGSHRVVVEQPGVARKTRTVRLRAGESREIVVDMREA